VEFFKYNARRRYALALERRVVKNEIIKCHKIFLFLLKNLCRNFFALVTLSRPLPPLYSVGFLNVLSCIPEEKTRKKKGAPKKNVAARCAAANIKKRSCLPASARLLERLCEGAEVKQQAK
jgi:hypothetical protein